MSTFSASPDALLRYSEVTVQLDDRLLFEASRLAHDLQRFSSSCTEYRIGVDDHLAHALRRYAHESSITDRWVGVIGARFQRADSVQLYWRPIQPLRPAMIGAGDLMAGSAAQHVLAQNGHRAWDALRQSAAQVSRTAGSLASRLSLGVAGRMVGGLAGFAVGSSVGGIAGGAIGSRVGGSIGRSAGEVFARALRPSTWRSLISTVGNWLGKAANFVAGLLQRLGAAFSRLLNILGSSLKTISNAVKALSHRFVNTVVGAVRWLFVDAPRKALEAVQALGRTAWNGLQMLSRAAWSKTTSWLRSGFDVVKRSGEYIIDAGKALLDTGGQIIKKTGGFISSVGGKIWDGIKAFGGMIKRGAEFITGLVKKLFNAFSNAIKTIWNGAKFIFKVARVLVPIVFRLAVRALKHILRETGQILLNMAAYVWDLVQDVAWNALAEALIFVTDHIGNMVAFLKKNPIILAAVSLIGAATLVPLLILSLPSMLLILGGTSSLMMSPIGVIGATITLAALNTGKVDDVFGHLHQWFWKEAMEHVSEDRLLKLAGELDQLEQVLVHVGVNP